MRISIRNFLNAGMTRAPEVRSIGPIVHLEPLEHTRETLTKWVTWLNDPDIRQWMYRDLPSSPEDINRWMYQATHDPRRHYFSICANGDLAGFVSLRQDHAPASTAEIGIVIGPKSLQSRGLGKQAIDAVLEYAKQTLRLSSVRAMIKPGNERSIRLFTGRGFSHTKDTNINGEPMMRFEKSLTEPDRKLEQARLLFEQIGLVSPDSAEMASAAKEFSRQLLSGGTGRDPSSSLLMIDTLLKPVSQETLTRHAGKQALIIEYGGTHVRLVIGEVGPDGIPAITTFEDGSHKKIEGTLSTTQFASPDEFFAELFHMMDATEGVLFPKELPKHIGIIWSFPGIAERTSHGVDVRSPEALTKGIHVKGMDRVLVGEALLHALVDRYYPNQTVSPDTNIIVLNDTPAVLFSYIPPDIREHRVGVVDGTGFNIAMYVNGNTYNLEAGSFLGIPLPEYAKRLEHTYDNPGLDLTEKQCSGKYVGDQFDAITGLLIDRGIINGTKRVKLGGRDMGRLLEGNFVLVEQKLGVVLTRDERAILTDLAVRLRDRAALIVGMLVGTVVRTFETGFADRVKVPTAGSFFIKMPGMREIADTVSSAVAGRSVEFLASDHRGIIGAVAAAVNS